MATKPIQPTLPFNPEEIKPSTVKAVDGLGLSMKEYYWDVSTQQFERRDNPPEHISSSDQKVGSPLHRKKYPERYGYHYTSKLEQAAFPIPGTAPSEKRDHSKHFVKTPKTEVKVAMPVIDHSLLRKSVADKNQVAALEKLRVFAFTPRPNDVVKGIGSLMKTIAVKPEEEI